MTGEEKMLATALRDLFGWHVGMVLTDAADDDLPDLDSPANWGHWVSATETATGCLPTSLHYLWGPELPAALARWVCEDKREVVRSRLPPSVLAWWKEHGQ